MNITYRVDVDISPDAPDDDNYCPYANIVTIRGYDAAGSMCEERQYINLAPQFFTNAAETAENPTLAAGFRAAAADIAAAYEGQF